MVRCFILHLFWNLNIVLQRRMHKTHVLSLKIHNKTIYPTEVKTIYLTEVKKENITGTLEATLRLPLCPLRPSPSLLEMRNLITVFTFTVLVVWSRGVAFVT